MGKSNGVYPGKWDRCRGCGKRMDGYLDDHLLEDCGLKPENSGQTDFSDFAG